MTNTRRRVGLIAVSATAVTLGLGAITGVATNLAFADPSPSPSTSSGASPRENRKDRADMLHHHRGGAFGRRALHGEAVVKNKDGEFVTVLQQRGSVTAVDSDSIAVKSEDGYAKTYVVDNDTRVRKDREKAEISAVKVGDIVIVVGVKDGDTSKAKGILVPPK